MFRKLIIVAGAVATVAAASLAAPTTASAGGWHGKHKYWHGWHGYGFHAPIYYGYGYGYGCYVVKKRVFTPYGPRIRRVQVCH